MRMFFFALFFGFFSSIYCDSCRIDLGDGVCCDSTRLGLWNSTVVRFPPANLPVSKCGKNVNIIDIYSTNCNVTIDWRALRILFPKTTRWFAPVFNSGHVCPWTCTFPCPTDLLCYPDPPLCSPGHYQPCINLCATVKLHYNYFL
jgi:hypothetical protein